MKEQQLSLDTFYSLVDEKVSENNKIEFKKFSFLGGKVTPEQKEKLEKEILHGYSIYPRMYFGEQSALY